LKALHHISVSSAETKHGEHGVNMGSTCMLHLGFLGGRRAVSAVVHRLQRGRALLLRVCLLHLPFGSGGGGGGDGDGVGGGSVGGGAVAGGRAG